MDNTVAVERLQSQPQVYTGKRAAEGVGLLLLTSCTGASCIVFASTLKKSETRRKKRRGAELFSGGRFRLGQLLLDEFAEVATAVAAGSASGELGVERFVLF